MLSHCLYGDHELVPRLEQYDLLAAFFSYQDHFAPARLRYYNGGDNSYFCAAPLVS